ncbi:hypothetical protein LSH36_200g02008 [Paralvinella palmiformis]|uniref:Uncharacterized protein n=1 Tax=Paralvinella palmiformis TaxID=53620 RepID=A0AAD9JPT3_9ANNE|nr:hypothetical protein LSH36_200g02008 [Paralvinella palmiformis]
MSVNIHVFIPTGETTHQKKSLFQPPRTFYPVTSETYRTFTSSLTSINIRRGQRSGLNHQSSTSRSGHTWFLDLTCMILHCEAVSFIAHQMEPRSQNRDPEANQSSYPSNDGHKNLVFSREIPK